MFFHHLALERLFLEGYHRWLQHCTQYSEGVTASHAGNDLSKHPVSDFTAVSCDQTHPPSKLRRTTSETAGPGIIVLILTNIWTFAPCDGSLVQQCENSLSLLLTELCVDLLWVLTYSNVRRHLNNKG